MVCLADRLAYKVPTAAEKQLLFKAGLGLKKIKFDVDDDEEAVRKRITSSETEYDSTEVIGFPQLRNCGGFKWMRCAANCRELVVIDGSWAVKELKANGGPQTKIYLRPIQKSLSTKPLSVEKTSQVRGKCISCNKEFLVHELRKHTFLCREMFDTSEESEDERQGVPTQTVNDVPEPLSNDTPSMATDILTSTDATPGHSASAPIIIHPDESVLDTPEKTVDDIVTELISITVLLMIYQIL